MDPDIQSDHSKDGSPAKKMKSEWSKTYSNKAIEIMEKMGYENDKGLGKQSQGILEPLTPFQQDGRRGLGLSFADRKFLNLWNKNEDNLQIPERIVWLKNDSDNWPFSLEHMKSWIRRGKKKLSLEDETLFCSPDVLQEVLEGKSLFDGLNSHELRKARTRSNPFESIRNSIFLNRAAVKMANIDSLCGFMFTSPFQESGEPFAKHNELLYFADLCAGPGGFSEYVLYRTSWSAKGFGFTLRGSNDFMLDKFFAGSPESFDPFYGVKDDGNIYDTDNQNSFSQYVHKHCVAGVHFVMADGGFSVDGQENIQEILSKRLYLCQCLTAITLLRPQGHFLCKFFDLFTPFSVALIYLMYKSFRKITIIKPNSSRPANSERYLVCKWKKSDTSDISAYLNHINILMNNVDEDDIISIIDIDIIKSDRAFSNFINESNNFIGKIQILNLKKVLAFYHDEQLKETRQTECRKFCLSLWKLPDKLRQPPEVKTTEHLLEQLLGNWYTDGGLLDTKATELSSKNSLSENIESVFDWYFVPVGREETFMNSCSIFLSKSRGNILRCTENKKWETLEFLFEIPSPSLFFGEIVYEYCGEAKTQTRICSLHIVDAVVLGGIDIRRLPLGDRMRMCSKFSLSISKPFKDGKSNSIRSKPFYKLTQMDCFFEKMQYYTLKDSSIRLGLSLGPEGKFFVPGGVLILSEICHRFFSLRSKTRNILYYFDKSDRKSYYVEDMPSEVKGVLYASFRNSFLRRLFWKWTSTAQVEKQSIESENHLLNRKNLIEFINNKL